MDDQWRVLMPKTQIFRTFIQSTAQAMELDPNRRTTLRLKAEFVDIISGAAELTIDIEEATRLEETAFVTSPTQQVVLGNDTTSAQVTQAVVSLAFSGRFVRVKAQASLGSTKWANLQAEVLVQ